MSAAYPNTNQSLSKLVVYTALLLSILGMPKGVVADDTGGAQQHQTQNFNIPAQPLAQALNAFIEVSDWQVGFPAGVARNVQSSPVKGAFTPSQALAKILAGTGIAYRLTGASKATLIKPSPKSELTPVNQNQDNVVVPNSNADTTLPKVTVEADADNPYDDPTWQTDPYNTDYVLPKATAGTKTNTPVMETPLNVQVISKQVLKDQQVISLEKALRNVSGVTTVKNVNGATDERLFLRGFETQTLFRNGFRMDANDYGNGQQFANVESVEVLKGPAAILYGRVEPGGMVNIVTKQPRATPYYSLNQQYGSFDLYRTSIDATGPLNKDDTLLYRMNASFQSNNSFRDLVSNEDVFLAPIIKWNISPRTQATLEMEYNHQLSSQDNQVLPFDDVKKRVKELPHSRNLGEHNPLETENIFVGFNWSHQFNDDWSIKHQVAFKRQDFNLGISASPNAISNNKVERFVFRANNTNDTIATNLDLTGHFKTWGLEHTLLFGGDYYRFDIFSHNRDSGDSRSLIDLINPVHPGTSASFDSSTTSKFISNTDNYGLYLQDQIKLPYNIHVMGGLRYQYVHKTSQFAGATGPFQPIPSQTDDAVTPRVGLLWQPQKWLSLYSNYAESFGANNGRGFKDKPLQPQSAQQWEVGAKTELFDGRLRATLAYYDLTKQNVPTKDTVHQNDPFCIGIGGCIAAVGEVHSQGPELDIQGEILPGWNMIATYANQDVRVAKSNDTEESGSTFLVGNRLQFTPRNIGSVWTTYEVQQGDFKGFKIGGGVNMQDGVVNADNKIKSTGYALVGLLAGYSFEVGKSKITAQLNVDNLLDKSYFTNVSSFGGNVAFGSFSTPRTFMGSINVEY